MSKARVADAERTAILTDLVRRRHEPEYVHGAYVAPHTIVLEEVAPGTGWTAARWADVLALGIWRKTGERLDGYEIKASRTDLKRELADLSKHHALARYCHTWTLVVWDESVLLPNIPEAWGIMLSAPGPFDGRELVLHRKPHRLTPEPWPRGFVASLVRNAYEQSPSAAFVARAAASAYRAGRSDGEHRAKLQYEEAVAPLAAHFYSHLAKWEWDWKKKAGPDALAPSALIARALEELQQGNLFRAKEETP
jgi:hypothetical protein